MHGGSAIGWIWSPGFWGYGGDGGVRQGTLLVRCRCGAEYRLDQALGTTGDSGYTLVGGPDGGDLEGGRCGSCYLHLFSRELRAALQALDKLGGVVVKYANSEDEVAAVEALLQLQGLGRFRFAPTGATSDQRRKRR